MDALQQLNLAAPIAATYNDLESTIIGHIAEQLAANPDTLINATSEWRIKMLAQAGKLNKDTARLIAAKTGKVPSEVEKVVDSAISAVMKEYDLEMTEGISENIAHALKSYDAQAVKDKYNQVNTVMQYKAKKAYVDGVNGVADRMARTMEKQIDNKQEHLDVLNSNALAVTMGEKSRTEALRETISQMSDKGIPAFVDASGKEWSPEAYVNMDIRNTAKNAALAAEFSCMDELGQDVLLVSSHSGARPLCFPYQGKFYSRSGKSGIIKDVKGKEYSYEPLSSTSFGEPAGLFGINCGHRMRGVSDGTFINREKQYDEKENGEEYEQVCEQRKLERKIRADKTKQNALRAAGDDEGAKALGSKITAENKQLKAYCEKNELSYNADRTAVYGYSNPEKKAVKSDFVETVDKSAQSGIINTGGYSGAKKTPGWRERHGECMKKSDIGQLMLSE